MISNPDEFVRLRTSTLPEEYMRAVEEEATIETWLTTIDKFPDMKKWVAMNKTIQLEILKILAQDSDSEVRSVVAEKRKLDRALFEELSRDIDEVVRKRVAYNKKVPSDILERLKNDSSQLVRDAAGR
jgi:hypothetical protein